MATRAIAPPPRTPSPKIRIHRSQSFGSPSSRISVTPIDDSPYSKSTGSIAVKALPQYDAVKAAEQGIMRSNKIVLHTKMSDDSIMSDASSEVSSAESSPVSPSSDSSRFALFSSGTPALPAAPSSPLPESPSMHDAPQILSSSLQIYQDAGSPMYDPFLVRVVLNMYDVRGLDWMMICDPVERIWGIQTTSAEVLGILSVNGRILGRRWWD